MPKLSYSLVGPGACSVPACVGCGGAKVEASTIIRPSVHGCTPTETLNSFTRSRDVRGRAARIPPFASEFMGVDRGRAALRRAPVLSRVGEPRGASYPPARDPCNEPQR